MDDRDHAGHPDRWIHQLAGDVIPMLAGEYTHPLPPDPPPGISDHHARIAAGLIFRHIDSPGKRPHRETFTSARILFRLPHVFEADPLLLTHAVLRHREIVVGHPALWHPGIYAPVRSALHALAPGLFRQLDNQPEQPDPSQPAETAPSPIRGP